jgi:hypothetical protein
MMAKIIQDGDRTVDGSLTTQLLQHLCGTSKSITRLSNGNVEDELLDAELLHGIGVFSFGHFRGLFVVVVKIVVSQKSRSSRAEYFEN